jgi:hypothetical protein
MNYEQAIVQLEYESKQIFEDMRQFQRDFKSSVTNGYRLAPEYKDLEKKVLIIGTAVAHIIKLQNDKYQKEIDDAVELKLKELWGID